MQQTSKYQFNLVDATDDFSPEPLNQNAQKAETLIAGLETDLTEGMEEVTDTLAELTANVGSTGHNARIVYGSYVGTGTYGRNSKNTLSFDFTPVLVVTSSNEYHNHITNPTIFLRGRTIACSENLYSNLDQCQKQTVSWSDTGVTWYCTDDAWGQNNVSGRTYFYVAIGYDSE